MVPACGQIQPQFPNLMGINLLYLMMTTLDRTSVYMPGIQLVPHLPKELGWEPEPWLCQSCAVIQWLLGGGSFLDFPGGKNGSTINIYKGVSWVSICS